MRRSILCALLVLAWIWTASPTIAEVSTDPVGSFGVDTIILGTITEDPDPFGKIWLRYRPIPANRVLNASGYDRGDGRPDVVCKTITEDPDPFGARPFVVWAYNAGADHDIAFSEWDGMTWTATEFLTSSTSDEVDPRIVVEADGTVHVAWWVPGVEKVFVATRLAGATNWDLPALVTDGSETGRRPSVLVLAGELKVAYERGSTAGGMAQDVVVATRQPGGAFEYEVVGSTARTEPLDIVAHMEEGRLWLDWKHEAAEFGSAEYRDGDWTSIDPAPWMDPSWVGVEDVRKDVRRQILGP